MRALVFYEPPRGLTFVPDHAMPVAAEGQVLVKLHTAALNHRDVWITQGKYPGIVTPVILGSDGAGSHAGRKVLINPNIQWGDNPRFPAPDYSILGMPVNGTLAEYVAVSPDRLHDQPPHLSDAEAAALPLAGLTAWRALFTKGQVAAGDRVLITGIGGGVALLAAQLAVSAGAHVFVTSGHAHKLEAAREMGAAGGVNYREAGWEKALQRVAGNFDLIIDSAGGEGFQALIKLAAPGGRIVSYGGGQGAVPSFSPQAIFWKQLHIMGTSMGSDQEFADMLAFVSLHRIKPVVDSVVSLEDAAEAFAKMAAGQQLGKLVIDILPTS